jgi:hypothetical protein
MRPVRPWLILFILVYFWSVPAHAGGALYITSNGTPSVWDNSDAILLDIEAGSCGPFANSEMLTKMEGIVALWTGLTEVNLSFTVATGTLPAIDSTNYTSYYYNGDAATTDNRSDLVNPIIFDEDGEITAEVAGEANQLFVLGFAGPVGLSTTDTEIYDGQAVINCMCIEGAADSDCVSSGVAIEYTETELDTTIMHEMGHFLNLDHSQVNVDFYDDAVTGNNVELPVMFPIILDRGSNLAATVDDKMILGSLYPATDFTSGVCIVTGDLLDSSSEELRCADVWAETSDTSETVAAVSGALAPASDSNLDNDTVDSGECESDCGFFQLYLPTGKDYTLTVKSIDSRFVGGSAISPCTNSQLTSITEEVLATVSSAQCTGGTTLYLGEFVTTSTGGTSGSGGSGAAGSSGVDDSLNPVGYLCSLMVRGERQRSQDLMQYVFLLSVLMYGIFRCFIYRRGRS